MRALLASLLLLAGCHHAAPPAAAPPPRVEAPSAPPEDPELLVGCCRQCAAASGRDPSGMDISLGPCAAYHGATFNGGPGVDDACAELLQARRVLVGDCWKMVAPR